MIKTMLAFSTCDRQDAPDLPTDAKGAAPKAFDAVSVIGTVQI